MKKQSTFIVPKIKRAQLNRDSHESMVSLISMRSAGSEAPFSDLSRPKNPMSSSTQSNNEGDSQQANDEQPKSYSVPPLQKLTFKPHAKI